MQRRRGGGGGGGDGRCVGVVVAGPSSYSTSGTPSGTPLGSSVDDCKPAWSSVNGSGPFGAAEDDALTAVSPNVVTFMNNTHRQDLALYALNYGEKLVRLSHLLCCDMHEAGRRFGGGGGGGGGVLLLLECCVPLALPRHVASGWKGVGGGERLHVGLVSRGGCVYPGPWRSPVDTDALRVCSGVYRGVLPAASPRFWLAACFTLQTDLALLDNVSLLSIDAMGAVLELLICVPSEDSCIAILERLPWPNAGTCTCVDDVVAAFGAMSIGVGLSGDI